MNYDRMQKEAKRLDEEICAIETQLKQFPPGKLVCTKSGKYYKWYQSDGKHWSYIPKSKRNLAEQLAAKKYLSCCLEEMLLVQHKIPYRYECALQLGDHTIYPDFTIRHPKTGEIFYWEHFGLMDDINYSKNVPGKLHTYITGGIIPSINLITTYETKNTPLSMELVEKTIEYYFL